MRPTTETETEMKQKEDLSSSWSGRPKLPGAVASPPRPRGRPPKPRDPFAPVPSPTKKAASSGSRRPRGRPPKKAKTAASSAPAVAPTGGSLRGRGRPPKVKPAVAPVGC
ncbi:HMG-Y-related protein A-like [Quercus robur]|uniref:HMG-Y-related protein A-like n=1 Tax=Quercus robur TaxID=38942 RepID=UPI0021627717|nr:HMG-Y-related protein A-like [Quercus robur]